MRELGWNGAVTTALSVGRGLTRREVLAGGVCAAAAVMRATRAGALTQGTAPAGAPQVIDVARLFDGQRVAVADSARIVVRDGTIAAVGRAADVAAPPGATLTRLDNATALPGLIDLHFHIEEDPALALRQLAHGITSFRDPGEWIEVHEPLRRRIRDEGLPGPRLFLTGPHIDGDHPAYPADSVVARDPEEARRQVHRAVDQGATAIKIYFRLPLASALAVIDACQARGVPSTAHLEILDARELIDAGLTGLEHITSFGTSIASPMQAERYRQAVLADNGARRDGRYALFAEADLDGAEARRLYEIVGRKRPFVDATLAVFEVQAADPPPKGSALTAATRTEGFRKMLALAKRLHDHGARIVMGGHTEVPHAARGEAPWRDLELLKDAGLSASEVLTAATATAAAFLGKGGADLGVIRPGAAADLLVVDGRPDEDVSAIRKTRLVLAAGRLVDLPRLRTM